MDLKVGQLQHRRLHQNALEGFKGFVACFFPFISDGGLLQEVYQRGRYLCTILYELAIIGGQSKKDLKAGTDLGGSQSKIALTL